MTDDPRIFYQARGGKVYDEEGNEAATARTAHGRDLERHADALEKAKKQRAAIERGAKIGETAELVAPSGSHHLSTDNYRNHPGEPFSKEELHPIVALDVPRVGRVRAQFSADRYVASVHDKRTGTDAPGWSPWRIYLREVRTPDEERPDLPHLGKPAAGIGPATRDAIDEAGRPLIEEWLENSGDYATSRKRAAANAVRRLFYDASAHSLDGIGRQLEMIAPELEPDDLERFRRALEARRESEQLLAETNHTS